MLDEDLKTQLKAYLERLQRPLVLVASIDDGEGSRDMLELLEDINEQSPMISVDVRRNDDVRTPSFAITAPGHDIHLRFAGLPMGHEFTSLVLALLQAGGHPSKAAPELLEQVRTLRADSADGLLHFETYFSQSCQNCPDVVQALNLAAVLNPNVRHVAIDGALFQAEVEAREILSVPSVYLNGELFEQGRMTLEQIVSRLDVGAAAREAAAIDTRETFDVLVVGGGPAGAAAAVYAARKGIRTGVVAERFGGQVLDTMAIENFISVQETEGPKLAAQLEQHVRQYEVDIMNLQRASKLEQDEDGVTTIHLESGASVRGRTVVLATGARWRQMNVPGEDQYKNKGVAYCPHCDGPLFKGKRVAVVGGGNSGVEAAIDLAGIVAQVTLIEFDSRLRADEVLQRKLRSLSNVTVITSGQTLEVLGDGSRVTGLVYRDRVGGDAHRVELEGI
ncbi:MAG TPA: alkyl hydroperoxide reductase subunit F, partial [Luteimonas sp.]|nr:alkyl hydroperoxide reductase subunit F [Luteimonas sp.]